MAEKYASNTRETNVERSTDDIRHDIAKEEEGISRTVEEIGERIKEKLDWREYVKDSPYVAMGAALGLGYLVSGMFIRRDTPVERVMRPIAREVRDSLGALRAEAAGPGLITAALLGIATKAVAGWIKNTTSKPVTSGGTRTANVGQECGPDSKKTILGG